jgi:DNA-binding XRE family transcriptional regulator
MATTVDQLTKDFSPERLARIRAKSDTFIKEYNTLLEFRKAIGLTQEDVAGRMNVAQESISRLEKRKDMHLSTLRKYVEALGGELEISVKMPPPKGGAATLSV